MEVKKYFLPQYFKKLKDFILSIGSVKRSYERSVEKKRNSRMKTILEYSLVIEEMPVKFKQMLTGKTDPVITPQESFIEHFKEAIPKYNSEIFKMKFVELFNHIGKRYMFNLFKKQNKSGLFDAGEF